MTTQQSYNLEGDSAPVAGAEVTVSLRNISPGVVTIDFMESVLALREQELSMKRSWLRSVRMKKAGSLLHIFRNEVVREFLDEDTSNYLLFIDSDLGFPADLLDRVVSFIQSHPEYPMVGVNYMIHVTEIAPCMFFSPPDNSTPIQMSKDAFDLLLNTEFGDAKYLEVDGGGAGCLFLSRKLLTEMREAEFDVAQEWFATETIDRVVRGEDMTFIDRVKRLGYKVPFLYDQGLSHYKGDTVMRERYV